MPGGVVYGQKSTMGAADLDLHINIEDKIKDYPKFRKELINRLNGSNFENEVKSHKYEWSNRDNRQLQTTVNVGGNSSIVQMVVNDPGVFNVDDVFQMPNGAQFLVEAVAGGINVTFRLVAGSQTALVSGETVTVIGGGTPQGKDADNMVVTPFQDFYNFTSILEDVVELTGTQHAALIRGDEGSDKLIARKQEELVEKLQRQLLVGQRYQDKGRKLTLLGGIKYMIDTYAPSANIIDFGGSSVWDSDADVLDVIDGGLDIVANKAFKKPVMYVSAKFMKKFKYVQDDTTRTTLREKARGIGVVGKYISHIYGDIDIIQFQGIGNLMDDLVFLLDESMIGYKAHRKRGWFTTPLAKLGDSYRWQVLGEYTFKMDIPEACVYFHTLGL